MVCTNGSSRAALNSGEKCDTHITTAKISQATTGNASTRITREWSTGRTRPLRVAGDESAQDQRDRRGHAR